MKPHTDGPGRSLTLIVPDGFDSKATGGNIYDRRLLQALKDAGVDADVVPLAGNWPKPDSAEEKELSAALRRGGNGGAARLPHERPPGTSPSGVPRGSRRILIDGFVAAGCPDAVENAVQSGADIRVLVHMPLALDPALDAETAARLNGLERRTLQAASGVICTSAWAADEVRRRHQVASAVAEPGVDPAPAAVGSVPPRILQVGTISPLKNQLTTVAALAQLDSYDWSARLIGPIGDSSYAGVVRDAIHAAGMEERITMTGQLTDEALARQWHEADISVLPSRTETYGMVVAESLAHAVPAVVSAGTGAEQTLGWDGTGNRPGFVVDTSTAGPLRGVLAEWLGDEGLRRRVKAAAKDRGAMLTAWESTAAAVLETLQ